MRFKTSTYFIYCFALLLTIIGSATCQDSTNPIGAVTSEFNPDTGAWTASVETDPIVTAVSAVPYVKTDLQAAQAVQAVPGTSANQQRLLWTLTGTGTAEYTGFVIQYITAVSDAVVTYPNTGFLPMSPSAQQKIQNGQGSNTRYIATGKPLVIAMLIALLCTLVTVAILLSIAIRSSARAHGMGTLSKAASVRSARSRPSTAQRPDLEDGYEDEDIDEIHVTPSPPPLPEKPDDRVVILDG